MSGDIRRSESRRGGWRGGRVIEPGVRGGRGGRRGRRGRDLPSQPRGRASPKTPTRGPLRCGARAARRPQSRADRRNRTTMSCGSIARATSTGGGTRYRVGSMVTEVRGDEKDRAGRNQPRGAALAAASGGHLEVPSRTREPAAAFRDERNREFAGRRLVREVTVWPAVFAPVGTPRALHCGRARVGERRTTRTRPRVRLTRTSASSAARAARRARSASAPTRARRVV